MQVNLCNTKSENNVIGKNINIIYSTECIIKGDISKINPTIILNYKNIRNINYLYIPEFNRYYFITNIRNILAERYEIECKVDVLESFKNEIKSLNCIIDKQKNKNISNVYINDGSYVTQNNEFNDVINFPNGFNEEGKFILICAGG